MQLTIFVDFYNLYCMLGKGTRKTTEAIAEIMRMAKRKGEITEVILFIPIFLENKSREINRMWHLINDLSLTFGLEIKACPVSRRGTSEGLKMKDWVDSSVLVHVTRHVHKDIGPELIIFVTGDADLKKSSTEAEHRSKKTEFWSVDPNNTSSFIRQEGSFREIEVSSTSSLQENPFAVALDKMLSGIDLSPQEVEALRLVARVPSLKLREQDEFDMVVLLNEKLNIPYELAQQLVEMLVVLGVADVDLAVKRVVRVNDLHVLFQRIQSQVGLDKQPSSDQGA